MKIAIFDEDYPDESNIPGDMFAHTRARYYAMNGHKVMVFRRGTKLKRLTYEGIDICDSPDTKSMLENLEIFAPDANAVHFAAEPFISEISTKLKAPLFVWVHGYEALAWHRRTFNMKPSDWYPHRLLFRHRRSRERLEAFSNLIDRSESGASIKFIFVSNWMKEICEADTGRLIPNSEIVPNPIDTHRFSPTAIKGKERNLLVVRSSATYKYAPDVISSIIKRLMVRGNNKFNCRIFSEGELFDRHFAPLAKIKGVELHKGFICQDEIVRQHAWGGVFLCPTRQDAQGVSMSEAMSSGLVVATTPVTAIPEFATDDCAILARSASQLTQYIEEHALDPELMARKSNLAAQFVRDELSAEAVCQRELAIMKPL